MICYVNVIKSKWSSYEFATFHFKWNIFLKDEKGFRLNYFWKDCLTWFLWSKGFIILLKRCFDGMTSRSFKLFWMYIRLRRLYIFMEVCLNGKISILKISYTMRIFYDGSMPKYDVDASCVINFKCLSKSKISQT